MKTRPLSQEGPPLSAFTGPGSRRSGWHSTFRLPGALLTAWLLASCGRAEPGMTSRPEQPVAFSHKVHLGDLDLECSHCHQYVATSRKATLPTLAVCAECHSEPQGESPEEAKIVSLVSAGAELNWQRIYALPKHVYFSHFRHVTLGQMSCPECHGDMKELDRPPTRPASDILNMEYCLDCHRQQKVSEDCLTCHQ